MTPSLQIKQLNHRLGEDMLVLRRLVESSAPDVAADLLDALDRFSGLRARLCALADALAQDEKLNAADKGE